MVGEHSFPYFCGGRTLLTWFVSSLDTTPFTKDAFRPLMLYPNSKSTGFSLPLSSMVQFNMMALVPLGSELERIMGTLRLLYLIILLAISNAVLHLLIALLVAYNPIHSYQYLMNECAIGFSGILFSMIVIETSLSGHQSRSVFGLFNVPAKCCVRRPKFIVCTGGNPSAFIPTYSTQGTPSSGFSAGSIWRNLSPWIPHRETSVQSAQDGRRFPGRGRTLGSGRSTVSDVDSESNLQARLLDNSNSERPSDVAVIGTGQQLSEGRWATLNSAAAEIPVHHQMQDYVASEEEIKKLVSMGFERTQVEVALAAADGDLNVAAEILSQQG